MTRKDYVLIARAVLTSLQAAGADNRARQAVAFTAEMLADELAATNPRFDRARFLKACGVQS